MTPFDFAGIGAQRYSLYLMAEFAMVVSPGAAVLLVMNRGLAQGFAASFAVSSAILSVNAFYFLASAIGLSALVVQYPSAFKLLQWAGAAYLIYLAWGAWTARPGGLSLSNAAKQSNAQAYLQALRIQFANPKAMLTFAAIVPPFVNPAYPVNAQMLWLAAGSMIPELIVLSLYGALAVRLRGVLNHPNRLQMVERLCAVLLVCIAAMIVCA